VPLVAALHAHARAHGAHAGPVVAPDHRLIRPPGAAGPVDPDALRDAGIALVPYTVNDPARMAELLDRGVRGMITDRPDLVMALLRSGAAPARRLLDGDGLLDPEVFDLQGHRGAAHLRPGNTLPAMEAALDALVTTLETDVRLTRDGALVLVHDPRLTDAAYRRPGGGPLRPADRVPAESLTLAQIRARVTADVMADAPAGAGDGAPSPVAEAVAAARGLPGPHAVPTLDDLVAFVDAYAAHHARRAGTDPDAARRARNARRVRLLLEIKVDGPAPGGRAATPAPAADVVRAVAHAVTGAALAGRVRVQCFDLATTLLVHRWCPGVPTAYLFGMPPVTPRAARPARGGPHGARDRRPGRPHAR